MYYVTFEYLGLFLFTLVFFLDNLLEHTTRRESRSGSKLQRAKGKKCVGGISSHTAPESSWRRVLEGNKQYTGDEHSDTITRTNESKAKDLVS